MGYMEDVMNYVEGLLSASSKTVTAQYDDLLNALNSKLQAVKNDHDSLRASRDGKAEPETSGPNVSTVYPDTDNQ